MSVVYEPGYDRPPYRIQEEPPRRGFLTNSQSARQAALLRLLVELLCPWLLARRWYGPYRMLRFSAGGVVAAAGPLIGPYAQPVAASVAEQAVDPVIERLLLPRALLGLGVVLLIVRLSTGTTFNDLFTDVFGDSLVVLLTGPFSLLVACAAVTGLARSGSRLRVSRMMVRPVVTALLTAGLATVVLWTAWNDNNGRVPDLGLGRSFLNLIWFVFFLGFALWMSTFALSAMYLMHRNAFAVRTHPLVRPLTSILLVWLTALGHAVLIDAVGGQPRTLAWVIGLIAGPIGVTLTAVIELVLLRRRQRVGFRGPLPARRV